MPILDNTSFVPQISNNTVMPTLSPPHLSAANTKSNSVEPDKPANESVLSLLLNTNKNDDLANSPNKMLSVALESNEQTTQNHNLVGPITLKQMNGSEPVQPLLTPKSLHDEEPPIKKQKSDVAHSPVKSKPNQRIWISPITNTEYIDLLSDDEENTAVPTDVLEQKEQFQCAKCDMFLESVLRRDSHERFEHQYYRDTAFATFFN
ncbi:hypothetical protein M3Y94_00320000 [Aphelenchoides besseyi]|nr:hypothetical protein M3Y94_00320000 [Aphelenchoides besseyi]